MNASDEGSLARRLRAPALAAITLAILLPAAATHVAHQWALADAETLITLLPIAQPVDDDDLLNDDDDLLAPDDDQPTIDDDDLLSEPDDDQPPVIDAEDLDVVDVAASLSHEQLFAQEQFPSARSCATCHPTQYREWSVSQHSYAMLSPVFNALHATMLKQTSGTFGDFCIRCHTPVGMTLKEPLFMSAMDRHPTSQEGVTCIVCHRINKAYGKVSGRLAIVPGDILAPIYGPTGPAELQRVLANPEKFKVVTKRGGAGRKIHTDAIKFFHITEPSFCGSCHDVTFVNGFRLEEAFSQYKRSPAAARGATCQDCHMGVEPGVDTGYAMGPAAVVGGVPTRTRQHASHLWVGPDYSVIHPGLFPHNPKARDFATMRQWTQFDVEAGWGTDDFENSSPDDATFPERWSSIDDRYEARQIIDENQKLLDWATEQRLVLLRNGYHLGDIITEQASDKGIRFKVEVKNATDGHPAPTGFDAERLVWLQVTVTDRNGDVVFKSGDLDPLADVRDLHSEYVHNGEAPLDRQLFTLQSRFITRNVRGGDREQVIAINFSQDPLPFVRPATRSNILLGRPGGARKHRKGIEPLGHRWAKYRIRGKDLTGEGPYTADIKLKAAMAPANLVRAIAGAGFDFNMSPADVALNVVAGHLTLWERTEVFDLHTESHRAPESD